MIIPVTPRARVMLAAALDHLNNTRAQLEADPHATTAQKKKILTAAALEFFKRLPSHDQAALKRAAPRDVFLTAVRAWRMAEPGIVRSVTACLLALQLPRIVPSIAAAQAQLRT